MIQLSAFPPRFLIHATVELCGGDTFTTAAVVCGIDLAHAEILARDVIRESYRGLPSYCNIERIDTRDAKNHQTT